MDFETTQNKLNAVIKCNVEKLNAANSLELKSELVILNKNGVNNVVLDLTKTKYCDSSGLSSILIGNRFCKDTNGKFVLCGLHPSVFKMIQISQLDKVLLIAENEVEAMKLL
ncbi:MAG: STAS domain-containing protein [Flavobacteriia bacterium]|nr:STAS domain-containing protein [Flavobacteriia bacterium]